MHGSEFVQDRAGADAGTPVRLRRRLQAFAMPRSKRSGALGSSVRGLSAMTATLFAGSHRKIGRAEQHIKELELMIRGFAKRFRQPTWRYQPGDHAVRFASPVTLAEIDEVGEVVGDAAHCLRAALDRMAVELVRLSNANQKQVYFPMGTDADHLDDQIKRKNFHRAGSDAVALLKRFAPHAGPGGNALLRMLHDLDVGDKHQAVAGLRQVVMLPTIIVDHANGGHGEFQGNIRIFRLGEEPLVTLPVSPTSTVMVSKQEPKKGYDYPIVDLWFDVPPPNHAPVVPELNKMAGMTTEIVETFAALFRARN